MIRMRDCMGGASADSIPSPTQRPGLTWDRALDDSELGDLPLPKPGARHAEDNVVRAIRSDRQ
jgi:hypothetical protein